MLENKKNFSREYWNQVVPLFFTTLYSVPSKHGPHTNRREQDYFMKLSVSDFHWQSLQATEILAFDWLGTNLSLKNHWHLSLSFLPAGSRTNDRLHNGMHVHECDQRHKYLPQFLRWSPQRKQHMCVYRGLWIGRGYKGELIYKWLEIFLWEKKKVLFCISLALCKKGLKDII